ncbi:hypothetical protein [Vallitalea sp.]|jgi:hypothetical protein|uniref:hypothetical protein n=1 Tax=Vallitalea sp. TaxID=1882829 RepID=UPI0025EBD471|nr:hypothetical protein [Vallitalea sp.]MCT4687498.1 hypothetical protein [Vallitalea sp.]
MKDGYKDFFNYFNINESDIISYGLDSIITIDATIIEKNWQHLKNELMNDKEVVIRGYGRDALGTNLYINAYKHIFNNNKVKKDPTNNANPQRLIQQLTGLKRNKDISNYQVSHVFGRTKNPLAFMAGWNIIYIPKILDPFTGHESKGELTKNFTLALQKLIYNKFNKQIDDFNRIVSDKELKLCIDEYIQHLKSDDSILDKKISQFEIDIRKEFTPILLNK